MKYVLAASSDRLVRECRNILGRVPGIEFRVGSVPGTGWDCDAAVLNSPLAYERYGGSPQIGNVQVLINDRGDGAPGAILATAPISAESTVADPSDEEIEGYVFDTLDSCVLAFVRRFPNRAEEGRILVHLEGAGIDRRNIGVPLKGVLRFFEVSQGA
ncbi:hypothetical protein QQY66_19570 [Streptomyces sp. DG2A-72]|uniref:hypothetical protein n=1 Tax=Streptomyces sp. DG2A-72 TaxID=3051386 RepID=UPI00265BA021|nr:hypothetical protein [Streptomyces sp. DG2A-72]MDO0933777.1 hypothetical protein [Streptomyces sp. DG2A-72]